MTTCGDGERIKAELEFVQLLANPQYLNCECGHHHYNDNKNC